MNTDAAPGKFARFRVAPVFLQAYTVFVIVVSILSMTVFFAPPLNRAIVPYTGWNPGMIYMFTIFFSVTAAIGGQRGQRRVIYGIVLLLGLGIGIGLFDMALAWKNPSMLQASQTNPYLVYAAQRPIFTVVAPLAWLLLLLSPVMRKWIKGDADTDGVGPKQYQFALVDLLYVMMVVAVCFALSIALVGVVKRKQQSLAMPNAAPQRGTSS
ncbi:MAG: hypothetical protein WD845_05115 [Pirellulales bacterium]